MSHDILFFDRGAFGTSHRRRIPLSFKPFEHSIKHESEFQINDDQYWIIKLIGSLSARRTQLIKLAS